MPEFTRQMTLAKRIMNHLDIMGGEENSQQISKAVTIEHSRTEHISVLRSLRALQRRGYVTIRHPVNEPEIVTITRKATENRQEWSN